MDVDQLGGTQTHVGMSNLRSKIKDWGLSHPTLEEVFLKLTNETGTDELK